MSNPWTDAELKKSINAYFKMLNYEKNRTKYIKAEENRELQKELSNRTSSSMSGYISEITVKEIDEEYKEVKALFSKDGVLKRFKLPEWCKTAVFHRDRGRCCSCGSDLTSMFNIESKRHFDHIIPLREGGLNDVSNIQLLCSICNAKKSNREIYTSNHYQFWY